MSRIEWRHDGRRILLPIVILRPESADLTQVAASALLDTGASNSGITRSIANRLGLAPAGKRPLISARAVIQVERYLFRIGLNAADGGAPAFPFVFGPVLGFELGEDLSVGPSGKIDAVLGMDVLNDCAFSMDRSGLCVLAFG